MCTPKELNGNGKDAENLKLEIKFVLQKTELDLRAAGLHILSMLVIIVFWGWHLYFRKKKTVLFTDCTYLK